jgi:hypothetical protein
MRMKILLLSSLVSAAALSACATGPGLPVDYMGNIRTQTDATEIADCIGRSVAAVPVQSKDGLVVDAPNAQPPRRYTVARTKVETVILIQGEYAPGVAVSDAAAVKCASSIR